jgi:hypothetical protein
VSDYVKTDKALNVLSGIATFTIFNLLIKLFCKFHKQERSQRLSVKDRILLVFMKMKLDLTYSAVGIFGDVSVSTCKRIFFNTVVCNGKDACFRYVRFSRWWYLKFQQCD